MTDYFIRNEAFHYKTPDSIRSEHAAPSQCAGATVHAALASVLQPAQRIGVLGLGGLGHLAVQFASKLGVEVVALSASPNKKEEVLRLGASEFVLGSELENVLGLIDFLVIAGSAAPTWQ